MMKVEILAEYGYEFALLGLSLSKNQPVENMPSVARRLSDKDGGHNKFLESIIAWLDIDAPFRWWKQVDTYRAPADGEDGFQPSGITKQSESTMHTILKRPLTQADFEKPIFQPTLDRLNLLIDSGDFEQVTIELPEGFLQRRIVTTNYKALRTIISQRRNHRLDEWAIFCQAVLEQAEHKEFLG